MRPVFLVLALLSGLVTATPAAGAAVTGPFTSTIVGRADGHCADVPTNDHQRIAGRLCDTGVTQQFRFTPVGADAYTIGTYTGSCLDAGGSVVERECDSDRSQQFRLQADSTNAYRLVSALTGKCIAPSDDRVSLTQVPCGVTSPAWRLPGREAGATAQAPPTKTVRVYWLRPSDVPHDDRYVTGIAKVMAEAQRYYRQELGKTFRLNNPVVEVVVGEKPRRWYETTPNGPERYWWEVFNMQQELRRRLQLGAPDNRWLNVGEISAEGPGTGGGGGNGWVMLPGHDARGAAGLNGPMNRWYGGMVHELGHAFGLPDSSSTDGTPMSASFYNYPNTHFNDRQKNGIRNGPYGSFLS